MNGQLLGNKHMPKSLNGEMQGKHQKVQKCLNGELVGKSYVK